MVVIAIIALLTSVALSSLNAARVNARASQAVSDLTRLRIALDLYYDTYNQYPNSQIPNSQYPWDGISSCWGESTTNWIPGLTTEFITSLPRSPNNTTDCDKNYIYNSNGTDYKLIWHNPENCAAMKAKRPELIDPSRNCWAYGYWTSGASTW